MPSQKFYRRADSIRDRTAVVYNNLIIGSPYHSIGIPMKGARAYPVAESNAKATQLER